MTSITELDTGLIARKIARVGNLTVSHFGEYLQVETVADELVCGVFIGSRLTKTGILLHLELDEGNGYSWRRWFRCSVDATVKVGRP